MEREANYVAVGAFMLVVIAMATVFVLWYSNARERREYQPYEVYFMGSVSGLNEGSTVRYLGVNVGRVSKIRLDSRDPKRVQVIVELDRSTPIKSNTLARLNFQGVTGLLFIDLYQAQADARGVNPEVESERYPVIRSVASDLDLFLSGLPDLAVQANKVTERVNRLLSDDNLLALSASLASVKTAAASLPAIAKETQGLASELRALTAQADRTAGRIDTLVDKTGPDVGATAEHLKVAADHLAATAERVDALLARHEADLDHFATQGLGDLASLARESRDAATEVRSLARTLRENPSRVIYQQPLPGVPVPP